MSVIPLSLLESRKPRRALGALINAAGRACAAPRGSWNHVREQTTQESTRREPKRAVSTAEQMC